VPNRGAEPTSAVQGPAPEAAEPSLKDVEGVGETEGRDEDNEAPPEPDGG
jgi:hypothetical protein